ncbi:MAG: type II toxin-antitoxin system HicA family toxin [Gammaproteobacteria bacterium]|nr:type II toxin-antitoxin system HicA family toxin [Gammaproteobacteria bacterium]
MSKRDKLIEKIQSRPKDFTWQETCGLLSSLGYELMKNDGSRRKFYNAETRAVLMVHEPHPRNYLLAYQVKDVLQHLKDKGLI